jgi:carbonic anhydrase
MDNHRAMTHDAFADVMTANAAAAERHTKPAPTGVARLGLAVVTCIDSRIDPLRMFGLQPGDAKFLRNAGARVTDDVERTLAAATAVLGVERVAVVAHTGCKMAAVTEDEVATAVAEASGAPVEMAAAVDYLTVDDQDAAVRADVKRLQNCRLLRQGTAVAGFVLDLTTGLLRPVT